MSSSNNIKICKDCLYVETNREKNSERNWCKKYSKWCSAARRECEYCNE